MVYVTQENDTERAVEEFCKILHGLPLYHSIPLRLLFQFLGQISSLSDINYMTQVRDCCSAF